MNMGSYWFCVINNNISFGFLAYNKYEEFYVYFGLILFYISAANNINCIIGIDVKITSDMTDLVLLWPIKLWFNLIIFMFLNKNYLNI